VRRIIVKRLLPSTFIAGVINATAFTVDANLIGAVSALVGTIVLTMVVVAWIDKRIAKQLEPVQVQLRELKEIILRVEELSAKKRG
jgi:O-antigen/teichoic acid export membrane protein